MNPFQRQPKAEPTDEDIAAAIREHVHQACDLQKKLKERGWNVGIFVGQDGSNSVDIDRRLKL